MANQLDPHHLVALMCYEFRSGQDGSTRRLDPPSDLTSGIVDRYGTNLRTRPVLDALAHISVSRPDFQVVAIALQFKQGFIRRVLEAESGGTAWEPGDRGIGWGPDPVATDPRGGGTAFEDRDISPGIPVLPGKVQEAGEEVVGRSF